MQQPLWDAEQNYISCAWSVLNFLFCETLCVFIQHW